MAAGLLITIDQASTRNAKDRQKFRPPREVRRELLNSMWQFQIGSRKTCAVALWATRKGHRMMIGRRRTQLERQEVTAIHGSAL